MTNSTGDLYKNVDAISRAVVEKIVPSQRRDAVRDLGFRLDGQPSIHNHIGGSNWLLRESRPARVKRRLIVTSL